MAEKVAQIQAVDQTAAVVAEQVDIPVMAAMVEQTTLQ